MKILSVIGAVILAASSVFAGEVVEVQAYLDSLNDKAAFGTALPRAIGSYWLIGELSIDDWSAEVYFDYRASRYCAESAFGLPEGYESTQCYVINPRPMNPLSFALARRGAGYQGEGVSLEENGDGTWTLEIEGDNYDYVYILEVFNPAKVKIVGLSRRSVRR